MPEVMPRSDDDEDDSVDNERYRILPELRDGLRVRRRALANHWRSWATLRPVDSDISSSSALDGYGSALWASIQDRRNFVTLASKSRRL